jgi:molybdopterin-guanine dinucleotide biosynthesis protein A
VGATRIVDRVAGALAAAADTLLLVANDDAAAEWLPGARTVADVRPGNGSLGGLHAALAHAETAVLVVAWDMPFVTGGLLARLRVLGEAALDADAVVPRVRTERGARPEPLCAYYGPGCLAAVERRLDAGERRLTALLGDLRVHWLDGAALAAHGEASVLFANVNTRDDLARATARAGSAA